jgi:tetratricopeptide (TPR) repeat protein
VLAGLAIECEAVIEVIHWIRILLDLFRQDQTGSVSDKELGTFLSVLGYKLTQKEDHVEAAIKTLGKAMLKLNKTRRSPDQQEADDKNMLLRENYRAFGTAFRGLEKYVLAIYYLTKYLSYDHLDIELPNVITANHLLAESYGQIGQHEESIKYRQGTLDVIKEDRHSLKNISLFSIGTSLMKLGDYAKAYKYQVEVFKDRKDHPDDSEPNYVQYFLHQSYALCQMHLKHYDLAIKNYNKAITLIETDQYTTNDNAMAKILDESSLCYVKLGKLKEALKPSAKAYAWKQSHITAAQAMGVPDGQILPFSTAYAWNDLYMGLLKYKLYEPKEAWRSKFMQFQTHPQSKDPMRFVAHTLKHCAVVEDLILFKKLMNQLLKKSRRRKHDTFRSKFNIVCHSVFVSKHLTSSATSLRISLMK